MLLTKFIEAGTTQELTERVQSAERDGWQYFGMQAVLAHRPEPVGGSLTQFESSHVMLLFAAMRREEKSARVEGAS